MSFLILRPRQSNKFNPVNGIPSQSERDLTALRGTALDADEHPILARHYWRGPLIVIGRLACNSSSPLVRRFDTAPVIEIEGPTGDDWQHVGPVADRVVAGIADKSKLKVA